MNRLTEESRTRNEFCCGPQPPRPGAHQQRRSIEFGAGIGGLFGDGGATRVIAVHAHCPRREEFRLVERTDHHGELRTADRLPGWRGDYY